MKTKSPREQILKAAISHTVGDRDKQYGSPVLNLGNTAALITAFLEGKTIGRIIGPVTTHSQYALTGEDAAMILVLVKMARTMTGLPKRDTYEDAAAYLAIAGECAEEEAE